mgnify:CR=1 FL=1
MTDRCKCIGGTNNDRIYNVPTPEGATHAASGSVGGAGSTARSGVGYNQGFQFAASTKRGNGGTGGDLRGRVAPGSFDAGPQVGGQVDGSGR